MNGHTIGFLPRTQKLVLHAISIKEELKAVYPRHLIIITGSNYRLKECVRCWGESEYENESEARNEYQFSAGRCPCKICGAASLLKKCLPTQKLENVLLSSNASSYRAREMPKILVNSEQKTTSPTEPVVCNYKGKKSEIIV